MSKIPIGRPKADEYADIHAGYLSKVPGDDVMNFLQHQLDSALALFTTIDDSKGDFRYEPGKWTIKEVLGHIVDTERVFAYRALVFARGDRTPLPGFDQEPWAQHAGHGKLAIRDIIAEFKSVRRSTIQLFQHLDAEAWNRRGTANGREISTRAAAFIIAGHAQHHLDILQARYLAH